MQIIRSGKRGGSGREPKVTLGHHVLPGNRVSGYAICLPQFCADVVILLEKPLQLLQLPLVELVLEATLAHQHGHRLCTFCNLHVPGDWLFWLLLILLVTAAGAMVPLFQVIHEA